MRRDHLDAVSPQFLAFEFPGAKPRNRRDLLIVELLGEQRHSLPRWCRKIFHSVLA